MGALGATPEQECERRAEIEASVPEFVKVVSAQLGEDRARELFEAAISRKRGKPKRAGFTEKEAHLLRLYDHFVDMFPHDKALIRGLAERVHRIDKSYGASAEAIEQHIRRVLAKRRRLTEVKPLSTSIELGLLHDVISAKGGPAFRRQTPEVRAGCSKTVSSSKEVGDVLEVLRVVPPHIASLIRMVLRFIRDPGDRK